MAVCLFRSEATGIIRRLSTNSLGTHVIVHYSDSAEVHSIREQDAPPLTLPNASIAIIHTEKEQTYDNTIIISIHARTNTVEISIFGGGRNFPHLPIEHNLPPNLVAKDDGSVNNRILLALPGFSNYFTFSGSQFVMASPDAKKVWIWQASKGEGTIRLSIVSSINLSNPISSILLTTNHLFVGEKGGIRAFPLPHEKDVDQTYFVPFGDQSDELCPVLEMLEVTPTCIVGRDTKNRFFATNAIQDRLKTVKLVLPFDKVFDVSIIRKSASRSELATVSGIIVMRVDSHSIYSASFKTVMMALEIEEHYREEIHLKSWKAIFTEVDVTDLLLVPPDYLFVGGGSNISLYTL
eukprot:TRINITY_DN1727_c3_g1_i2.p1 TRINITY_DN1727_c3_g1~~TRINITY_DN1727_c3_g1_i2.p1  ORF type:complete len:351 (+),score=68.23 TRINITY_DN1727_c3_g1_i2:19-1071(+)